MTDADAIRAIYRQIEAPPWAAANLDALLDVLRDLSWLPEGPVSIGGAVPARVRAVLRQAAAETAAGPRPVRITDPGVPHT